MPLVAALARLPVLAALAAAYRPPLPDGPLPAGDTETLEVLSTARVRQTGRGLPSRQSSAPLVPSASAGLALPQLSRSTSAASLERRQPQQLERPSQAAAAVQPQPSYNTPASAVQPHQPQQLQAQPDRTTSASAVHDQPRQLQAQPDSTIPAAAGQPHQLQAQPDPATPASAVQPHQPQAQPDRITPAAAFHPDRPQQLQAQLDRINSMVDDVLSGPALAPPRRSSSESSSSSSAAQLSGALRGHHHTHSDNYSYTEWRQCVLRWQPQKPTKPHEAEHVPGCVGMCLSQVKGCSGDFLPQAFEDTSGATDASFAAGLNASLSSVMAAIADKGTEDVKAKGLILKAVPAAYKAGFGETASHVTSQLAVDTAWNVRRALAEIALPAASKAGFGEAASHVAAQLANDTEAYVRMSVARYALPAACEAGFGEAASHSAARLAADANAGVRWRVAEFALPAACEAGFGDAACGMAAQLADDADASVRERVAVFALPAAREAGFGEAASRTAARLAADTHPGVRSAAAHFGLPAAFKAGVASDSSQILVRALNDSRPGVQEAAAKTMEEVAAQLPRLGSEGLKLLAATSGSQSGLARATSQALAHELVTNLSEQAGIIVEIWDNMLCAQAGSMLLLSPGAPFGIQAHHCPNTQACNTSRCLPLEHADSPANPAMCSEGHRSSSAGCSRCEPGHGRSLRDPFQCETCSNNRWRQMVPHVISPVAIYAMALRSSYSEKSQVGSVLKIMVAFGTTSSMTLRALLRADDVVEMSRMFKGMIDPAILSLEIASGAGGSSSLDCLLARDTGTADLATLRAALVAVPISLLALTFVGQCSMAAWRQDSLRDLFIFFLKTYLVWTAVFLPTLLMSSLLTVPCVSTQVTAMEARTEWMAWDLHRECGSERKWVPVLMVTVVLAAGPLTWLWLMTQSHTFPADMLSFLVGGYKPGNHYWEVVVLSRRSIDTVVIVLMPLTYAAFSQTLATAGLMAAAGFLHAYVQPYEDPMLNMLEFLNLLSNTVAVILTSYVTGGSWSQTPAMKVAAFVVATFLLLGTGTALAAALLVSALRRKSSW